MKIHKEGYIIITVAVLLYLAISALCFWWTPWVGYFVAIAGLIITLFVVRFFRVPHRETPELSQKVIYSPCDGKVVEIGEVFESEYLKENVLKISVFMSVNNVHVNWFPVGGEIEYFKYHKGKYLVAWAEKSSEINERTTTVVNTGEHKVLFRQIAGFLARRIVNRTAQGQTARQCSECGFIKFGSRMDIFMPLGTEVAVNIGEVVTGTQTILAHLKGTSKN
ncbi:MAG: phosphatidylserine decarboxylase family protein [Rikenellaceae bacterium]